MKFQCFQELSSSMRPTAGMHHLGPADLFISGIAVALQNAFVPSQEPFRSLASAPELEVKDHATARFAVLPQIRLMMLAPFVLPLHSDRCFIGLQIGTAE